jgi:hypothetical protein
MTRINVVPVETLTREHLVAEYRELPRVFTLAANAKNGWWKKQPQSYTLGTGHVLFFYNRLKFLADRHKQLVHEMLKRGYKPNFTECLEAQFRQHIPEQYWFDYKPTEEALKINRERIKERLNGV